MTDFSDNIISPVDLAFHQNLASALLEDVHVRGFLALLNDELLRRELARLDVLQDEVIDLWNTTEHRMLQDNIEEKMFCY